MLSTLLLLTLACDTEPAWQAVGLRGQVTPPAETLALLTLEPVQLPEGSSRAPEWSGLLTAVVELGLADLEGVVPQVQGQALSPGLDLAVLARAERWSLSLSAEVSDSEVSIKGTLCPEDGACTFPSADEDTVQAATTALLEQVALDMVRRRSVEAAMDWSRPLSMDSYAVLLAGRAAATYYGFLPAPEAELVGDKRRDPIARALLVDPKMSVAQWVYARRAMALGDAESAQVHFALASDARSSSALLAADEAQAWAGLDRWDRVGQALAQVRARAGEDLRFALPRARAALALKLPEEAQERLRPLESEARADARLAELRVEVEEALGQGEGYDPALLDWEIAAPGSPEPTRRRAMLRVRQAQYEEALGFCLALSERGAPEEAARLELGLYVALQRWDEAAQRAQSLGLQPLDHRLRARGAQTDQARLLLLAGDPDPYAQVWGGETQLALGHHAEALALADGVLATQPYLPEALALRVAALEALGREKDAEIARVRLAAVVGEG